MSRITTLGTCRFVALGAAAFFLLSAVPAVADEHHDSQFVYVMTNQASGNTVVVFENEANGTLKQVQEISTGGNGSGGSGDPLGSQGSLTLNEDRSLLFAVNAGSNEITSFTVSSGGLTFADKQPSGGTKPVSIAVDGDVLYVANAGGTPNITGFAIGDSGQLQPIPNSTRALPGGSSASPAQVGFTPDDEALVVTDKGNNMIDLFPLQDHAEAVGPVVSVPSNGATPFAFGFGRRRTLIVTEAAASTISSYRLQGEEDNQLATITASLPDTGQAACWMVVTGNHRYAFVVNSGTATISSLRVAPDGSLSLLSAAAGSTPPGSGPLDAALSSEGKYLYVITTHTGMLTAFRVSGGQLTSVASVSGLPLSIQGIAAE